MNRTRPVKCLAVFSSVDIRNYWMIGETLEQASATLALNINQYYVTLQHEAADSLSVTHRSLPVISSTIFPGLHLTFLDI
jgi:hypothetical protein